MQVKSHVLKTQLAKARALDSSTISTRKARGHFSAENLETHQTVVVPHPKLSKAHTREEFLRLDPLPRAVRSLRECRRQFATTDKDSPA